MGASWAAMWFTSSVAPSNLTVLPRFLLPPERDSLSLCGRCSPYLAGYSFSTLHSSVDCPGQYNKHLFSLVVFCLGFASAALLRVGRRGGLSFLLFSAITYTIGICPNCIFRSCYTFVDFSATSILSNRSHLNL